MKGTINCIYETPCGWCSKWDKKCDKLMYTSGFRAKHPQPLIFVDDDITNMQRCEGEEDHEWECTGIGTNGTTYTCKKCYAQKKYPAQPHEMSVTF